MKKLINVTLAIALATGGILAGAAAGKLLPSVATLLGSTPAIAEGLSAQAAGPLTPSPVGGGFTYQGRLLNNGNPASGSYDFTFRLYDQSSAGSLVSGPISVTTTLTNGLFTANLDFGSTAFNGDARYMEIAARQTGGGSYATLLPRQPITAAPYALYALKTKGYKNVVTVAQDGGNYTSITAALNSITDNSATNRYLVWIAPGTYTETVTMKAYVDVEGSGEGITRITQTGSTGANIGTVVGASNAELRALTVENTGGGANYAIAIYNNGSSLTISEVTTNVTGGLDRRGVYNSNSSPWIKRSAISADGGVNNYGIYSSSGGTVTIDDSRITGSTNSIYNDTGVTVKVAASVLSGGAVFNNGTITCGASLDGNNKRLGALCTPDTKTVLVATTGGDFTSIQAALNSITDNSATNKYLVRVAPGVYTETVTMKQYVDIEGSGEGATKITYAGSAGLSTGTAVGANNAELRSLTVQNTGGNTYAVAIFNNNASPSLLHVTATASGGTANYGEYNFLSSPTMTGVRSSASGGGDSYGVYNSNSSAVMKDVTASASGASTANYGVFNFSVSTLTMTGVTASASGGSSSYAVLNDYNSSPNMNNVTANASGGTYNYGVANFNSSSPNMNKVTAYASGGSPYAVYNQISSPTISNSTLTSVGLDALFNTGGSTVLVRNSQLTGNIWTASGTDTVKMGGSYMNGGIGGFGPVTCAGNYDENFVFFPNTCP